MKLIAEIADTPDKQSMGLMFRKSLEFDEGMLFKFEKPKKLGFWNVNTFIPLDIAFIDKDNVITEISRINATSNVSVTRPQVVTSSKDCVLAIETNAGFFSDHKIKEGQVIRIDEGPGGKAIISFSDNVKTAQQLIDKKDEMSPAKFTNRSLLDNMNNYENPGNLPVISLDEISSILEDSYDEDTDEYQPTEPEVSPETQDMAPTDEPQEPFPVPEEEEYPNFGNAADALMYAQDQNEVLRIWYQTKRGRDIERSVAPHGIFFAETTGNTIAVTYDFDVGDIRAFIVDNILHFNFEGKKFEPMFLVKQ